MFCSQHEVEMKFIWIAPLMLALSCSQLSLKRTPTSSEDAPVAEASDSVDVDWSALEKIEEVSDEGHALVEASESEAEIAQAVGSDVDEQEGIEDDKDKNPNLPFLKKVRTKRVKFWIDYFTNRQRDRFQRFLNNGEMYRPIIEKIMDEQGVPRELFYVGLIESGYYLGAHSHAAAVGPWQFIRGTGLRYGMTINREFDERRDIFKATVAAAQYFKDLHGIFSSWELALAAYNAGEYGIIRRIQRYKTRDYYKLSRDNRIPKETINYVPKVLAAMHVAENAEKYGFVRPRGRAQFWQKTKLITAPKGATLHQIANRLNVSALVLKKLNPELRSSRTPRSVRGPYSLRVPAGKQTEWLETLVAESPATNPRAREIEVLNDKVMNPGIYAASETFVTRAPTRAPASIFYKVRRGDSLSSIARRNKMSLKSLALLNRLTVKSKVRIGQGLRLSGGQGTVAVRRPVAPVRVASSKKVARAPAVKTPPIVYRLGRGETLTDVSRWFKVSVNELKKANKVTKGRSLHVGTKIKIPNTRRGSYTVRRGDGLIRVAEKFGLNQTALMRLNNLKQSNIYPGQRLVVNLE